MLSSGAPRGPGEAPRDWKGRERVRPKDARAGIWKKELAPPEETVGDGVTPVGSEPALLPAESRATDSVGEAGGVGGRGCGSAAPKVGAEAECAGGFSVEEECPPRKKGRAGPRNMKPRASLTPSLLLVLLVLAVVLLVVLLGPLELLSLPLSAPLLLGVALCSSPPSAPPLLGGAMAPPLVVPL